MKWSRRAVSVINNQKFNAVIYVYDEKPDPFLL